MGDQADPAGLDLMGTARRAGAARWLDARLFEVIGGWVPTVAEPEVKIALATQASHHGWHAQLWAERLPALHGVDPASWVEPAPGVEAAMAALAAAENTVARLVGVQRVLLPRLVVAHTEHLAIASPSADGPTIRTLRLVLQDEVEDQRTGEGLLQRLLRTREAVEKAASFQARIETLLAEAGPILG